MMQKVSTSLNYMAVWHSNKLLTYFPLEWTFDSSKHSILISVHGIHLPHWQWKRCFMVLAHSTKIYLVGICRLSRKQVPCLRVLNHSTKTYVHGLTTFHIVRRTIYLLGQVARMMIPQSLIIMDHLCIKVRHNHKNNICTFSYKGGDGSDPSYISPLRST